MHGEWIQGIMLSCCAAWPGSLESCRNGGASLGWSTAPDPDGNEGIFSSIPLLPLCIASCGQDLLTLWSLTSQGWAFYFETSLGWRLAVRCCLRALLTGERSHAIWQVKGISFIPDEEIYHKMAALTQLPRCGVGRSGCLIYTLEWVSLFRWLVIMPDNTPVH